MAGASKTPRAKVARGASSTTLDYLGVKIELPAKLPGDFMFAYAEIHERINGDEEPFAEILSLARSVIGDDGLTQIREASAKRSTDGGFSELLGLLYAIPGAYHTSAGE